MSEKKKSKEAKEKTPAKQPKRNAKGQFTKGNTVGEETRFNNGNNAAGKYDDKYCDAIIKYFAEPQHEIVYERSYYKDGTVKSEKPIILPPKFPTFEMFAASIGVTPQTLINWGEKYPRFLIAYERAKTMQLGIAKANGVTKMYDSNFTKFVLVNDHGMSDKQAIEQTQDKPFEVNINVVRKPQK